MLAVSFGDFLYWIIVLALLVFAVWLLIQPALGALYRRQNGLQKPKQKDNTTYYHRL